ncbi:MAG: hypothetical protein KGD63_13830 [Candidatus Lokiarchaeota archaeon]|nr:hypothetical protein [Candidatus Lokiarchaeota archaeon]
MSDLMIESRIQRKKLFYVFLIGITIIISSIGLFFLIESIKPKGPGVNWEKPAIYLYPREKTKVKVSLSINGEITVSDPEYNDGWSVIAYPNGTIEGGYNYLFYEARLNYLEDPLKGWCIKYNFLENWMDIILIEMGLNNDEKEEFKEFWLNFLPKTDYYLIKLMSKEYLEINWDLFIDPLPDIIIRILLTFKPSQNPLKIENPVIISPKRTGFTVVEWGGTLLN